jgi:hypothetical protein
LSPNISTPAGVASISRGSSDATPPVKCEESSRTPAGVPASFEQGDASMSVESSHHWVLRAESRSCISRCCDPSGVGFGTYRSRNRGCRFAQSPANRWHPCRGACRPCERDANWAVQIARSAVVPAIDGVRSLTIRIVRQRAPRPRGTAGARPQEGASVLRDFESV